MTPHTRLSSTNCDASVSLKAKISQSNIAHMGNTSILFRNMPWSWSRHGSMSSQFLGMKQFAPFNRRRKPLGRPDGNTTGVSILVREGDGKRQDILIEAVPGLRRMAVLTYVNDAITARLDALQEAARAHGIEFSIHRVAKGGEIAAAIDSAQASGATALNIVAAPLFYANRHLIMERAAAAHLPTIYEFPETAEEGGFAAYGPRRGQFYAEIMPRQIVKLFRGTKIADIPVEQPTKFELVINLKTANAMGVTVPAILVARADKVIE
jgi:putative tryptophan/tyrosine transport system substrate-binding protein